jgi:hypothetical protein
VIDLQSSDAGGLGIDEGLPLPVHVSEYSAAVQASWHFAGEPSQISNFGCGTQPGPEPPSVVFAFGGHVHVLASFFEEERQQNEPPGFLSGLQSWSALGACSAHDTLPSTHSPPADSQALPTAASVAAWERQHNAPPGLFKGPQS